MTALAARRIELRLEQMVGAERGLTARHALMAADRRLDLIRDDCRRELDVRLERLNAFARRDPAQRPPDQTLERVILEAEAALTACGALNRPMLGRALGLLCAMAHALMHTRYWPEGALNPAINLVGLCRAGDLPGPQGEVMLQALERCLAQYLRHIER